ncbi:serine-type D-Ala-D-Ala carboxypeptidase [Gammaproteobacteria bacterium 53_120_T64]|nr:serine-type D-Ala-D-Ala carboxypeptidase [Gammaproteobacteria bacterium 53_120_T64]
MLKALSTQLITLLIITISVVVSAQAQTLIPAAPQLAAKSWILIDANTGRVLVEANADLPLPPASLTKIMSSYVVAGEMASGKFSDADQVPISVTAWKMGGSKMFVREGTEVPLGDLLKGIIIQSGNDATVAMAEFLAGSESAFADVMNQQAVLLGMKSSYFVNATGWPAEGHITTARDLSLLAQALILEHPSHYALYAEKYYEYNGIKQPNRNRLLWRDKSVDGMKTGHTEEAGYCLVASAERNGMRLISVVMGTNSEEARAQESQKLLTYGFRYYETTKVFSAGDVLQADNRVWFGERDSVDLVLAEDVFLTFPRGAKAQLDSNIHVDATLEAPLTEQQELGRLVVTYKDEVLADKKLVAAQPIAEAGLFSRLWDSLVLFVMSLL